jgi:hypothetical protein
MEIKAQLMQKLDYGPAFVRRAGDMKQVGLTTKDTELLKRLAAAKGINRLRLFNVINGLNRSELAPEYDYREGDTFAIGRYEQWSTTFVCATDRERSMFRIDFRDPGTAIKSATSKESDPLTFLGRFADGDKTKIAYPNLSINRLLEVRKFEVSSALCPKGANLVAGDNGVFYTDRYGKEVFGEPASNRMRQYIEPGFSVTFDGNFALSDDRVNGLYENATEGSYLDPSFALDPTKN